MLSNLGGVTSSKGEGTVTSSLSFWRVVAGVLIIGAGIVAHGEVERLLQKPSLGTIGWIVLAAAVVAWLIDTLAHESRNRFRRQAIERAEIQFKPLVENCADLVCTIDATNCRLSYVNPAAQRMLGFAAHEILALPMESTFVDDSLQRLRIVLDEILAGWNRGAADSRRVIEVDCRHKQGHLVHAEMALSLCVDEAGQVASFMGVVRDITQRRQAEETMRNLAFYDGLTQLANRRLLLDRLRLALAKAARDDSRVAVLFIDLDNFKPVNDEFGHGVGDWLLKAVAQRLVECLRVYDTAARFGGDEFVVLLPDLHEQREALAVAERIRSALQESFVTPNLAAIDLSSSIGVAVYPDHAKLETDLLRWSDVAMYQAKKAGRNQVRFAQSNAPSSMPPASDTKGHPQSLVRLHRAAQNASSGAQETLRATGITNTGLDEHASRNASRVSPLRGVS